MEVPILGDMNRKQNQQVLFGSTPHLDQGTRITPSSGTSARDGLGHSRTRDAMLRVL